MKTARVEGARATATNGSNNNTFLTDALFKMAGATKV